MTAVIDARDDKELFYQGENLTYEEVYRRNGSELLTVDEMIQTISSIIGEIVQDSEQAQAQPCLTSFQASTLPKISVADYLKRIVTYSKCSQECLVLALIYLDRLTERNKNIALTSLNIHR